MKPRPTRRSQGGSHVVKLDIVNNRLVPNAMEPRAAIAIYDPAEEHFTLYTTSQNPHVARLVLSAFYDIAPENKLRVIAPDVGGGFGSKIFIYPEEMVCLWASKKTGAPGQMDRRPHRELPHRRAWPRPCDQGRDGLRRGQQDHGPEGEDLSPISAPTCRCSRRRCRPISTRRCCRASTTSRHLRRGDAASTPTPRRSMPIAAPGGPKPPSSSSG